MSGSFLLVLLGRLTHLGFPSKRRKGTSCRFFIFLNLALHFTRRRGEIHTSMLPILTVTDSESNGPRMRESGDLAASFRGNGEGEHGRPGNGPRRSSSGRHSSPHSPGRRSLRFSLSRVRLPLYFLLN